MEGNKMKKFSSLCLALVLSVSVNVNAALEVISLEGSNAQEVAEEVAYYQGNFSYAWIAQGLVSLLEKMGKVETAKLYEAYMSQFVDEPFNEDSEDEISARVLDFFSRFTPNRFDPKEVGLFALIHDMSFENAMAILERNGVNGMKRKGIALEDSSYEDGEQEAIPLSLKRQEVAPLNISITGLSARKMADVVEGYRRQQYSVKECDFAPLLREIGEERLASNYEEYRKQLARDIVENKRQEDFDEIVKFMALRFFHEMKFRPDPSDLEAVAVYALIHEMSLEEAMESLAR